MKFLFDNTLAPITSTFGFLKADIALVVKAYLEWQGPLQKNRGVVLQSHSLSFSDLKTALQKLLPLTSVEARRFVFLPTQSPWVAYFDNGYRGPDPVSMIAVLANMLECLTVRATVTSRPYHALIWEVYGPEKSALLLPRRAVTCMDDGGRWRFEQLGTPFDFELTEKYNARKIRDRLSFEMLETYLEKLGLLPFEEDFYLPPSHKNGMFIEKIGPTASRLKEYSLEEARTS